MNEFLEYLNKVHKTDKRPLKELALLKLSIEVAAEYGVSESDITTAFCSQGCITP